MVHALVRQGARKVHVLNRSVSRATRLTEQLASEGTAVRADGLTARAFRSLAPSADLVINATSGRGDRVVTTLDVDALRPDAVWVDLNYWQPDPPARSRCHARGLRFQTGHAMLVHQAALAFEHFTGRSPDAAATLADLAAVQRQPR